ncbi:MAG: hypothetical protein COT16_01075 [Elusimicrobia bacterium CG08_land_8_20_14_0_20_44_26]|nr:MAG: hypothetical protein COT16_01075 [Elusimicrobia bacterium CG08_land_8_20_14_0_20_44_26]
MSNAVLILFLALSGMAIYMSFSNRFSFLLIVLAFAIISFRTKFVFVSWKFIILLAAAGFIFYAAGRIFKKASKIFSIISAVVVFVLALIRIC